MRKLSTLDLNRFSAVDYSNAPKIPVTVVLDNIRSAQNIGSFFRTCDSFKLERLFLCGISATPPSGEIHKSALGSEQTVLWDYFSDTVEAVRILKRSGYHIICVEQVSGSTSLEYFMVDKDKKYALIFGNELHGVSQVVVDISDTHLEIPQGGTKHSLNVSVAGGIVLWEFYKQLELNK